MAYHALAASAHLNELAGQRRRSSALPTIKKDKPTIDIKLEDHQAGSFVPSYTTLDRIKGTAIITCPVDTQFDSIHILLQGTTRTYVERFLSASSPTIPRTNAYHNFLRLVQPMDDVDTVPSDNILRAGAVYRIPFIFVVPETLLPMACRHELDSPVVHENHLQLPPSLGDPMMSGSEGVLLDDLAPPCSVISYCLRVVVVKRETTESGGSTRKPLVDSLKKVRVQPRVDEAPPLQVAADGKDDFYFHRRKSLRKGIFKGKMGTLLASASQPSPIRLPYIREDANPDRHGATMSEIQLKFLPAEEDSNPPKISHCFIRLKVGTFYATKPLSILPGKAASFAYDPSRGSIQDTVHLASRRLGSVPWTRHNEKPSDPEATLDTYYTARVLVPVELPRSEKTFVPTFHCCLVSRVYALDISLSAKAAFGSSATLHLKVPVQILQEGNPNPEPLISPSEASAIRQREEVLSEMIRRASQASGSPGRNASVSSMRNNSITGGSLNPRYTVGGEDDIPGMADLALRGARGSVWSTNEVRAPPTIAEDPGANGPSIDDTNGADEITEGPDDLDDEPESLAAMAAALAADADDVQASFTNRARGADEPPSYTPHNGLVARARYY